MNVIPSTSTVWQMTPISFDAENTSARHCRIPSTSGSTPLGRNKAGKQKHLLTAIENHNAKDVIQLLRAGCSPSKKLDCYKSRYPLAVAIEQQDVEIICILLQHGACVNTPIHSSGWTALHLAVVLKNIDIIDSILQYNVDSNATDANGETVLHLVFKEGHSEYTFNGERKIIRILKTFLDLGMNVNVKTNAGRSPLYLAVKNKMKVVVDFLIERGADLNTFDYKGESLVHLLLKDHYKMLWNVTVEKRNFEEQEFVKFLAWLLLKGINVDRENKIGELPLQLALKYKLKLAFETLLQYAKNVNFTDDFNRTLLHVWFGMNSPKEINNNSNISNVELNLESNKESESLKILRVLIIKRASVDATDNNGNTPLHIAAENKMMKCLLIMLDRFTNVNACNNNSDTLLHILSSINANYEDDTAADIINVARILLFRGIDVNKRNKYHMTAAQLAVLNKNQEMLELLKNDGADLDIRTIHGESLLHLAIKSSNKKGFWRNCKDDRKTNGILEILLNAGVDVNSMTKNGETPLYLAVKNRMKSAIELLIKKGADVNICNRDGDSVVHNLINENFKMMCTMYDDGIQSEDEISTRVRENLDFMDWLLTNGVSVDQKNDCGERPLQLAIKYNLLRIIPILLKYANDVSFINERKLTILHIILQLNNQNINDSGYESTSEVLEPYVKIFDAKTVVQTLLDKGVSVEIRDNYKNTALHIAAQQTEPELTSILLKHTTNVNATNDLGWTPLHFACQSGNVEVVQTLIDHGADVEATEDISSITPLFVAAYNDHDDVIEVLAKAGADLNARDVSDQTVLHTVDSFKSSMNVILRLGADVDARDKWGRVPLYYAMIRQDAEAIGRFLDFGANVGEKTLSNFVLYELLGSDSVMGHHAKLMAAQLSIPKVYTSLTFRGYAGFYKECLKEVERMRGCKIDGCTTMYDFLHRSAKSRHAVESKKMFQDVKKLIKEFPIYCDMIYAKCQEYRIKKKLIKSATCAWWQLTDIPLPDICVENVLQYVDKLTLKGMNEHTRTFKRQGSRDSLNFNPVKRRRLL